MALLVMRLFRRAPVAPTVNPNLAPKDILDSEVKLYTLLVDQLQRYNTIFWQFPTALVGINALAVVQLAKEPLELLALVVFNLSMVFAFIKLVTRQDVLIKTARSTEAHLRRQFPHFVPTFKQTRLRAPRMVCKTLLGLNFALALYVLARM